ncbi:hypothetical protein F511_12284 [Dorcoceras hygrometricum]|uniref:Uncharacterized protein n=1 Tax=Dorcoceras hygrometricum TaxID=472368 RepID=A0A2Z7BT09_9LAMI|nr:hypothetical protein F511_12284 [Dorcoceras hygrometricum]
MLGRNIARASRGQHAPSRNQRPSCAAASIIASASLRPAQHLAVPRAASARPARTAVLNVAQRFALPAAYCRAAMRRAASKRVGHQRASAARRCGGRYRQSGPRPETGFLRQPALEGLTRSARTDSPRQDWSETIFRRREAAVATHGGGGL